MTGWWSQRAGDPPHPRGGRNKNKYNKKIFDSFQNQFKNFSQKTGKFLIPIK
jgi:hypothetical protein